MSERVISYYRLQFVNYDNNKLLAKYKFYNINPPIYRENDYVHFDDILYKVREFGAYFQDETLVHKVFIEAVET